MRSPPSIWKRITRNPPISAHALWNTACHDTGLHPAQADHARHLDAGMLGVPVVAAGIPTLMEAEEGADLVVTPRALDSVIAHGSALLAAAINRALQPRLSVAQLCWLTG